jgi:hypothetical protein
MHPSREGNSSWATSQAFAGNNRYDIDTVRVQTRPSRDTIRKDGASLSELLLHGFAHPLASTIRQLNLDVSFGTSLFIDGVAVSIYAQRSVGQDGARVIASGQPQPLENSRTARL